MRASRENAKPSLLRRALACLVSTAMVVAFTPVVAWGGEGNPSIDRDFEPVGTAGAADTEGCASLVDGDINTKWCVTNFTSAYIIFKTLDQIAVSGYSITTGGDNAENPGRNPKTWTLYGCNDYSGSSTGSWTPIHSVTDDTTLEDKDKETYHFLFNKQTPYQYFKLMVTAIGRGTVMQMSEFALMDCEHSLGEPVVTAPTCTVAGFTSTTCSICNRTMFYSRTQPSHDFSGDGGACKHCGRTRSEIYFYYDADGTRKECLSNATEITAETTSWSGTAENPGWYFLEGTVTIPQRVIVTGDVRLILADGCKLTVKGGIQVWVDGQTTPSLTIYGQSEGTGNLTAQNVPDKNAGIGGGSDGQKYHNCGTVVINGGTVNATGGRAGSGIGGASDGGSCGTVVINGGTVNATGGIGGAGIGGRNNDGGTIKINGGTVTASGKNGGAGIGGNGNSCHGGNIAISGGTVNATGSSAGAGIGGGMGGHGGNIAISGGTVNATGGNGGAGIGGGMNGNGGNIAISGGTVNATGGSSGTGIGGGMNGSSGTFKTQEDGKPAGNAVIFASSISDNTSSSSWSGMIFEGSSEGKVYGSPTLCSDLTIPDGTGATASYAKTLTVPNGETLTIASGKTLTIPQGSTLTNEGAITNSGKIYVDGTFTDNAGTPTEGAVYYPLTLNADSGNISDSAFNSSGIERYDSKKYYKFGVVTPLPTPQKTGYTFGGWYSNEGLTNGPVTEITAAETGVKTYWAKWTVNTYNITYDLNGGAASNPKSYTVESTDITLANPAKTGYTFTGWSGTGLPGENNMTVTIPQGSIDNRTYTAHWQPNTNTQYTVEHYQQNLDGSDYTLANTDNLTSTTGESVTPAVKSYTGFTAPATQTVSITAEGTTVVRYYYARDSYVVTFNANGHGTAPSDQTIRYEAKASKPGDPSEAGYTFGGWYTDQACSESSRFNFSTAITSNITLYAKWTANGDTAYKVEHYQQKVDGTGYELKETENCKGTTATTATATSKSYTGFTFNSSVEGTVKSDTIAGDGSLVLKLYYDRNVHSVTYKITGSLFANNSYKTIGNIRFGTALSLISDNMEKQGYVWNGWVGLPSTMPDNDVTVTGNYTAATNTPYVVKHWQQKVDGSEEQNDANYTLANTDNLTGTTGESATPAVKSYTGFTAPSTQTASIAADGSTVVNYYYTRIPYTITFDSNGGTAVDSITQRYGSSVDAPAEPTKTGYTFKSWHEDSDCLLLPYTFPITLTHNAKVYAKWTANTDTAYKVEHWQQNLDGSSYTLAGADNLTGTTAAQVTPAVKSYVGFTAPATTTATIAPDGSTVVSYYYTRNSYTVTFDTGGGTEIASVTKKYDEDVIAPVNNPTKTGYTFVGWSPSLPAKMPAGDMTVTAQWTVNQYTITFEENGGSPVTDITQDYGTALSLPASAKSGYSFGGWYSDSTLATKYTGTTMPADNITLYAKWNYVPPATPQASADCIKAIDALPDVDAITLEDGEAIEAARAAFDALTDYQKSFVPAASVTKLEAAEARYADLVVVAPVEAALAALPVADELKARDAKKAVKAAKRALKQVSTLTESQHSLVDEQLVANAENVIAQGEKLIAKADKSAVKRVKNKAFSVKYGKSKVIIFKTKKSTAGTKVVYKKTKGSKLITVTKTGMVTAKKGLKVGKHTAKIKVTCGKSNKFVKVVVVTVG